MRKLLYAMLVAGAAAPAFLFAKNDITASEQVAAIRNEYVMLHYLQNPGAIKPLTDEETREVIRLGAEWLANAQEDNGHMAYEYSPYADTYAEDDNIVRQAGALYQLGEIELRDAGNDYHLEKTIERSIKYFDSLSKTGIYENERFRCITASLESNTCKLGATSLAFIGILDYVTAHPEIEKKHRDLIDDYGTYLVAMQKENGGFREIFYANTGIAKPDESPYANGEGLLALVRYAKYRGFPEDLEVRVDRTVAYIKSPAVAFDSSLYLWAMTALKDWDEHKPDETNFDYMKRYSDWRMAPFATKRSNMHNYCAYVEGLAAAYPVFEKHTAGAELARYRSEIDFWLAKSALLQVRDTMLVKFDATMPGFFGKANRPELAIGGFLTGHAELTQRIDFTQHCISAYLQTLVDTDGKML